MSDNKEAAAKKMTTPKFMFTMDGMGMESTVKGFEKFTEVIEWGLDSHCYTSPQISGSFSQQEPPSCSPLYLRLPLGLHMPKMVKAMIKKNPVAKKSQLVMLASINNANTVIMELNLESVTVEEVSLGNNLRGKNNKNQRDVNKNDENSFEILLRFGTIEWKYISFKQDGGKEGQDTAGLNIMTGVME